MKRYWTTTQLTAIGALAALGLVVSLPGAIVAALMGTSFIGAGVNVIAIGIFYPLVALLFKKVGSVTLWTLIGGILALPFPIAGPPGFLLKIPYFVFWGVLTDLTYLIFRKSEKAAAIAISAFGIGPALILAPLFWKILGADQLAKQYSAFSPWYFVLAASVVGGLLGYLSYLIYKKIEKTAIVERIQK
jgi:hypothetical protein